MAKNTFAPLNLNSRAKFSKKYVNKTVQWIFDHDPDYLVYCHDNKMANLNKEVVDKLEVYVKNNKKRGIKKVTRFR